jgi:hypothetical protein
MKFLKKLKYKIKKYSILELSLVKLTTVFLTLLAVKQFPNLIGLNWHWYFIGAVFLSIKPLRTIYRHKYQKHALLEDN